MSEWFHGLPPNLLPEIRAHWAKVRPKEAVGLILDDTTVVPLKNWSKNKDRFLVGFWSILWKLGWGSLRYGDGIKMVYHTHTVSPEPSESDLVAMNHIAERWPHVMFLIYVPDSTFAVWHHSPQWPDH